MNFHRQVNPFAKHLGVPARPEFIPNPRDRKNRAPRKEVKPFVEFGYVLWTDFSDLTNVHLRRENPVGTMSALKNVVDLHNVLYGLTNKDLQIFPPETPAWFYTLLNGKCRVDARSLPQERATNRP